MSVEEHPKEILARLEQRARRRFGQHFLWRTDLVQRIVMGARVAPGDRVVEVGPGLGILTRALVAAGADLTAVELDRDLAQLIRETIPAVNLVEADAVRVHWAELCPGSGWKVVANLPYNVGTGLVMDWLRIPGTFQSLTVMLQREVVDRLVANPGSKAYGAISVLAQARARCVLVTVVPPSAFHPPPKVDSAVLRLELFPEPTMGASSPVHFERVVRAAFSQRRKTVANSLGALFGKSVALEALAHTGIEPTVRAERLDLAAFTALAAALPPLATPPPPEDDR